MGNHSPANRATAEPADDQQLIVGGFAVVSELCSLAECREIARRLETDSASPGTRRLLEQDWCRDLAGQLRSRLADRFASLRNLVAIGCSSFRKTAETNWFVPPHQDRTVPVAEHVRRDPSLRYSRKEGHLFVQPPDSVLDRLLAVRLHLDDSHADNGPLRVIPGGHRFGTLTAEEIERLRIRHGETTLTAPVGGVILMRPLLPHSSPKMRTTAPRRVLHFLYAPTDPPAGVEWEPIV